MQPLSLLWLGLLLGIRHAADPDHVVAIGAIAARTRDLRAAATLGVVWGLGHMLTLLVVASGIILSNWVVPPRVGLAMEFCVAIAIVVVGVLNVGCTAHRGIDEAHRRGPARAFTVGIVHGLAGSAAVALLVVATVRDAWWACAYVAVFGAGTIVGMTLITTVLALPLMTAAQHVQGGASLMRAVSGIASIAFGAWLAYQVGFSDGLFLATPTWTPH
jgi:hypothetical protein